MEQISNTKEIHSQETPTNRPPSLDNFFDNQLNSAFPSLTDSYESVSPIETVLSPIRETMTEDLKSGMLFLPNELKVKRCEKK